MGTPDARSMSSRSPMSATPASDDEPLVYALDRRGPNDRRFNSAHALVFVMATVLFGTAIVLL
ncbi:MAG: hypothetical protein CL424_19750 [Acidimicrobiaceae bacterium]|nr:hypothetical protein [Acidimicrobiaceae bacterium]